jgi:hypothetical protein
MARYQVPAPTWGWRREKIDSSAGWRGNLASPTVVVEQDIGDGKRLSVTLVETRAGIEVQDAEIWQWQAEQGAEQGGYWVPVRQVSAQQIEVRQ